MPKICDLPRPIFFGHVGQVRRPQTLNATTGVYIDVQSLLCQGTGTVGQLMGQRWRVCKNTGLHYIRCSFIVLCCGVVPVCVARTNVNVLLLGVVEFWSVDATDKGVGLYGGGCVDEKTQLDGDVSSVVVLNVCPVQDEGETGDTTVLDCVPQEGFKDGGGRCNEKGCGSAVAEEEGEKKRQHVSRKWCGVWRVCLRYCRFLLLASKRLHLGDAARLKSTGEC